MPSPPWWRGAAAVAGATPLLLAFPLFRLAVRLYAQIGLWRTAGTLAVTLAAAILVVGLAWRLARPLQGRIGWLLGLVTAANLAAIGLSIWFFSPRLAPGWALALAGAIWVVFALAWTRQQPAERQLATRGLVGVGLAVVLGLVLLLPGVARAAWDERAFAPAGPAPAPAGAARADRPQRIVLVTVDALRARSVDLAPGGRTPAFARLAAEATAFSHAHAVADATLFSMPTVLSGLSPRELEAARARWMHGRLGAAPSNALREGMLRGLPAQLAPAGYRSYYANKLIDPELVGMADEFAEGFAYAPISALDNGFNVRAFLPFDAIWRDLTHRRQPPADHAGALVENFARAEAYYRRPDPHAFIWLHLGVPHTPYRKIVCRPDGELSEADGPPVEFDAVAGADKQALAGFEGMYEDEVRYLDQELGRFLERLRGDPRWGATMLVLTADHGEAFQPGAEPHGTGVMSEDLTHVPLLIHAPGQRTGRVEPGLASGLDVVPTVLARTYNPPPAGFSGLALDRPIPPERMVGSWGLYPRALPGGEHAVAAYLGPYKYRRFYPDGREELVELPGERNVAAAHPAELARLRDFVARELPPARNGR